MLICKYVYKLWKFINKKHMPILIYQMKLHKFTEVRLPSSILFWVWRLSGAWSLKTISPWPHSSTLSNIKMINNGDRGIFKNNQIPWWCHQFFSRRALNSGYKTMDSPSSTFSWSYFFLMSSSRKASVFTVFREFIIFNYGLNLFNLAGIKRRNNYIPKISERRLPFFRCIAPKLFEFLVILHGCVMFLDRTLQIFGHNNSYQFLIS